MATRLDYRNSLKDMLTGLQFSGYGDFEFLPTELDTYLEMALARLFPALHKRSTLSNQPVVAYGNLNLGKVAVAIPESRVFMVEDSTELTPAFGWSTRPGKVVGIPDPASGPVDIHYYESYTMPSDDVTALTIPPEWKVVVVTGAALEALSARRDAGERPDPPSGGEMSAFDRLAARYQSLVRDLGMNLPVVVS